MADGTQCGMPRGNKEDPEKFDGYCYPHAKQMNALDVTVVQQHRAAQSEGVTKMHARQRQDYEFGAGNVKNTKNRGSKMNTPAIDPDILDMIAEREYSLKDNLELYRQLDMGDGESNYNEMFAFAEWLDADTKTRKPKKLEEVAEVLGVQAVTTLKSWRKNKRLDEIRKNIFRRRMQGPKVQRLFGVCLLQKLKLGDARAMAEYSKLFIDDRKTKKDKSVKDSFVLDKTLLDKGREIAGKSLKSDSSERRLRGTPKLIADRLIDDMYENGDVEQ